MGKLGYIILAIICIAVGFTLYHFRDMSPLNTIFSSITNGGTSIITSIKENPYVLSILAPAITVTGYVAKIFYDKSQSNTSQQINGLNEEVVNAHMTVSAMQKEVEATKLEADTKVSTMAETVSKTVDTLNEAQLQLTEKDTEIRALREEKQLWYNKYKKLEAEKPLVQ